MCGQQSSSLFDEMVSIFCDLPFVDPFPGLILMVGSWDVVIFHYLFSLLEFDM